MVGIAYLLRKEEEEEGLEARQQRRHEKALAMPAAPSFALAVEEAFPMAVGP